MVGARKDQCVDKRVQYVEARSQAHIKSSLPYDFPLGFYGEGTILLYLWPQVYCLSGRTTVRAGLPAMGAALQAADTVQGLAS